MLDPIDRRILEDNPALLKQDWLPEDPPWSDLGEIRDEQLWYLERLSEAMAATHAVMSKFRQEDAERAEAAKRAVHNGGSKKDLPKVTLQAERERQMGEAAEQHTAVLAAFAEFLRNSTNAISESIPDRLDDLKVEREEADAKILATRQALADAEVEKAKLDQLEMWLVKHRGGARGQITAFGDTSTPTPAVLRQQATGHQDEITAADGEVIGVLRGLSAGEVIEVG